MSWLLEQPDRILSASEFHYDILEGSYAFNDPHILRDPYHERVVHKFLPRRVGAVVPSMWEELSRAIDDTWGTDTETWKEIHVFDNLMTIIPRTVNHILVGSPLCRNKVYLANMAKFATAVVTASSLYLRFTPKWLKPLVGPLATIPNNRHYRTTAELTLPIIEERLANHKRKNEDPSFEWGEPNDFISWHIALAMAEDRQDELTPDRISGRLMPINFAAIHTTAMTTTHLLFDLISSDPSNHDLDGIRDEAQRILAEEGGHRTKAGLGRCHRADSAIRESMRVLNFMTRGVVRKVMPTEGIENKIEGWRAPRGAYIGLDVHSVQHDPDVYPRPEMYDAFRFSRPKEESHETSKDGNSDDAADILRLKNTGLVTTSDSFLNFGHGRHACPGRFFVALELQMLLAYMVLNYEVKPLASRPPNKWFGGVNLPPMKASIKVRRRKGTV